MVLPDPELRDEVATTPLEKANMLAEFFSRQCPSSTEDMTNLTVCPYPLPESQPTFESPQYRRRLY